jgi:hypothetical protein
VSLASSKEQTAYIDASWCSSQIRKLGAVQAPSSGHGFAKERQIMQGSVARVGLWGLGRFFSTNNLQRVIKMIGRFF